MIARLIFGSGGSETAFWGMLGHFAGDRGSATSLSIRLPSEKKYVKKVTFLWKP